jgi:hypothetical protein
MNRFLICLLLVSTAVWSADWETFPLRENGSIPVWLIAGPFPNPTDGVGNAPGGLQQDFLQANGGESKTIPAEGDQINLPSIHFSSGKLHSVRIPGC